ncbi:MAG: hypothetical protein KBG00_09910 [Rhodoferax sp.]|jgi:hypothetical protein|uniref:hypothetical protein n=1 Tax=Rhodoferax sp. TaxID=50421 RepID=UPI001B6774DC|nr:hypothetical protein [Rhodoferax sp.]MBP9149082.1 hypothetical protein [Rhodoferax sp.]MBP9737730.1 hypothetical protein [Rhodoferax sp.]
MQVNQAIAIMVNHSPMVRYPSHRAQRRGRHHHTLTAQVAFGSIVTQPTIAPNVKLNQVSAQG